MSNKNDDSVSSNAQAMREAARFREQLSSVPTPSAPEVKTLAQTAVDKPAVDVKGIFLDAWNRLVDPEIAGISFEKEWEMIVGTSEEVKGELLGPICEEDARNFAEACMMSAMMAGLELKLYDFHRKWTTLHDVTFLKLGERYKVDRKDPDTQLAINLGTGTVHLSKMQKGGVDELKKLLEKLGVK